MIQNILVFLIAFGLMTYSIFKALSLPKNKKTGWILSFFGWSMVIFIMTIIFINSIEI